MTLFQKTLILITLMGILGATAIGITTYTLTESVLEKAIAERQLELTRETLDKIDRVLYERYNDIQSIATEDRIEAFLSENGNNGDELETNLKNRLNDLLLLTGPWDTLDVIDQKGVIQYSTESKKIGQNSLDKIYYATALEKIKNNEIYISDIIKKEGTDKATILFAAAVKNSQKKNNPIVGMVVGHFTWPVITEILEEVEINTIELFNQAELQIGDGDIENDEKFLKADPSKKSILEKAFLGQQSSEIALLKEKKGYMEMLVSYANEQGFLNYKGNGWVLLLQTPTEIAFKEVNTTATMIPKILIPMVIFTIITFFLFLHRIILSPALGLTKIMQGFTQGDLSKRAVIKSNDEMGILAKSFNQMADKLQELYTNLEEKVKEKTSSLSPVSESYTNLEEKVKEKTAQLSENLEKLEEAKAKDDALLAYLGEGMIAIDNRAKVVKINQKTKDLLDLSEHCLDKEIYNCFKLFDTRGAFIPKEQHPSYIALNTGEFTENTFEIHKKNGSKRIINILANPVRQSEKIIGVIMIIRDVTKEKEIDRMKTEFISLASHQLRTPLSAIKWFTEMLLSGDAGELNSEQKDFAQNVSDSTQRMLQLVNSLLNISRIESGRIIIEPKPTDLRELVQGVINDLKAKIEEKKHHIIISVHQELPEINIDARLIRQVYMNLLTNSIKYTPKNGEISVLISKKDKEIITQISDNGYGIPKEDQGRMFQKFFRADNVVKVETDGTGLGLYLIKAIIDSSGGKIWFQSEEGKGTTFWFTLPLEGMKAQEGEVTLDS